MEPALKQRLIGAVVLVALAVIFLPMLIKGPAPDSGVSDVSLDVPERPTSGYETRELPLAAPGAVPAGGVAGLETETAVAGNDPVDGVADAAPASAAGNYVVGFGAYATVADAQAVIARLAQSRLPAYREPATINGRQAYRVRIGPYVERADAEAARLQAVTIRNDVNAQVLVLDAQPVTPAAQAQAASSPSPQPAAAPAQAAVQAAPAPAPPAPVASAPSPVATPAPAPAAQQPTRPASPPPQKATPAAAAVAPAAAPAAATPARAAAGLGFAVQLGAFAREADANALRDRVRGGGFSAFVEPVRTDKGTLHRVRVGPVANRAEAERLKSQLGSKYGIDGMIRPHP